MPIRSHTPITASSHAAVPSGTPRSPQNGTRCAWVSPKLEMPQIANVSARIQNTPLREPSASACRLSRTKPSVGTGGTGATVVSPSAGSPRSCGRSRASHRKASQDRAAPMLGISSATRQPQRSLTQAASGMKTSVPVAMAPPSKPSTSPRCCTNQRDATTALSCIAVIPGASPSSTPMPSHSCHFSRVVMAMKRPIISRAPDSATMRRGP